MVCDLGTITGAITALAEFEALKSTLPDRTLNEVSAAFDPDGDGPAGRHRIGPASDDVEIIEVLALPPLGDGAATAEPLSTPLGAALAGIGLAALLTLGGRARTASTVERSND